MQDPPPLAQEAPLEEVEVQHELLAYKLLPNLVLFPVSSSSLLVVNFFLVFWAEGESMWKIKGVGSLG